jgi:hypothetical protein
MKDATLAYAIGWLGCAFACTTARPPPLSEPAQSVPPTAAASSAAHGDTGAADEAAAQALVGAWAEYWAVRGGADTERRPRARVSPSSARERTCGQTAR